MKLSNNLSGFTHKNILLIVAGKQDAALYHIHDGSIDELVKFVTPRPEYSDNEGKFQASVNGNVYSGAFEGYQDEDMIRDFIHEFKDKTKDLTAEFDEVYLTAPAASRAKLKESLPKVWQDKITLVKDGNYFKQSPIEILEMVSKHDEQDFKPQSPEEEKILSVPQQ